MIELRVNGERYTDFVDLSLKRSIDNASGQLDFGVSKRFLDIGAGDLIQAVVDNEKKLTGYIDSVDCDTGETELMQTFTARDKIADLIDSSLPDEVKTFQSGMNAVLMLENVIKSLKMSQTIINNAGTIKPFKWIERIAGEAGMGAFELVSGYLRKRGIFINSDGAGNIVLYKLSGDLRSSYSFENLRTGKTNIIDSIGKMNLAERYGTYVCKSQASVENNNGESSNFNRTGKAVDPEVRETRYHEFVSEESMSTDECKQRAEEEANIRRARSFEYVVNVAGHSQDGIVYDIGKGARVNDESAGVKGVLLVRAVELKTSKDVGDVTEITMTYPDAYSLEASISQKAQKKIDINRYLSSKKSDSGGKFKGEVF